MIIFKDAFNGHEIFTDSNAMQTTNDGQVYRVTCKEVQMKIGNDFDIGANASQEESGEQLEEVVQHGIDICIHNSLEEVTSDICTKKLFKTYFASYAKRLLKRIEKLVENKKAVAEDVDKFKQAAKDVIKEVTDNFDDVQFFRPLRNYEIEEDDETEPFTFPLVRKDDKITILYFRLGLDEEKA